MYVLSSSCAFFGILNYLCFISLTNFKHFYLRNSIYWTDYRGTIMAYLAFYYNCEIKQSINFSSHERIFNERFWRVLLTCITLQLHFSIASNSISAAFFFVGNMTSQYDIPWITTNSSIKYLNIPTFDYSRPLTVTVFTPISLYISVFPTNLPGRYLDAAYNRFQQSAL